MSTNIKMKVILSFALIAMLLCTSSYAEMTLFADIVTTEETSHVCFDNVTCTNVVLRIDYPEYGIGEGQNVLLEVNGLPAIMLWHDANIDYTVFRTEYLEGAIHTTSAYGGNELFLPENAEGIVDTEENEIVSCKILGDAIPIGTHIRVWTDSSIGGG